MDICSRTTQALAATWPRPLSQTLTIRHPIAVLDWSSRISLSAPASACSAAWHRSSSCAGCRKPKPENKSELRKMRGSIARCSPGCKPSWQRFLSDPALRIESLRDTSSAFADASVSKSHDVVPAIHVDHFAGNAGRSEEHTSELQSRRDLVCRLLLEKKKHNIIK